MYKLAVIGDKDSVLPFNILGLDTFFINSFDTIDEKKIKIKKIIEYLVAKKYGIIYITEELAKDSMDIINRYKANVTPVITLIPNNLGSQNIGLKDIDGNIEKAIGTNIF